MISNLKNKRLLIMGGMRISCEIVRKAREMGIYTVVADYNKISLSPAKQIADETVEINVIDVDNVVAYIKDHAIDGVFVGFNDMLLPYYAEICRKADLPCYGTKEQFLALTNKNKYKALLHKFGVPVVPEYDISSSNIIYPVIVKPVDSSGSRGVSICHDSTKLQAAIEGGRKASKSGQVIVEEYMQSNEVTAFWVFQNGNYYLTALGNRHVRQNQGAEVIPLPVGYTFPSTFLPRYRAVYEENCKRLFRYLGLKDGMLFMQCIVKDDICYVYDLGFRLTGSLEYRMLERICGYNPMEMMIRHALTGRMCEESIADKIEPNFNMPAFNVSFLCAPGTIDSITGIEDVKSFPEVEDVVIAHAPGETISKDMRGLLAQITVRVIGTVKKKESLQPVIRKIENTIHIFDRNHRELHLPGMSDIDIQSLVI